MLKKEAAILEAIIYLENEPVEISVLSRISKLSKDVVVEVLKQMQEHYAADEEHGIDLVELGGGYLFMPKKDLWNNLKGRYGKKNEDKLSKSAMETLSIIAYSQPITKAELENIRGVSCSGMLKLLLSKELIRIVGKKDAPGRPAQYGTTKEFLQLFQLSSIADLPKIGRAHV